MRRLLQIVFCLLTSLLLVLPHAWVGAAFQWQQYRLKSTLAQRISAENGHERLLSLSFGIDDFEKGKIKNFHWRNNSEFTYKGVFYDIIETEYSGNQIRLKVYADYEETVSHTQQKQVLALLWKNQSNPNKNTTGFFGILKSFFIQPSSKIAFSTLYYTDINHNFAYKNPLYTYFFYSLTDPPPQLKG